MRIKKIQQFLSDYQSLPPHLQMILEDSRDFYIRELGKEYNNISNHHYPKEYTGIEHLNNTNRHEIRTLQTL